MKRNVLQEYRERFNTAVDEAIKECSRPTGITDLETVYRKLKKTTSMLLKRLTVLLADEQIRIIIQKRLKRCTVSVEEVEAKQLKNARQDEFDFFEMEQFRGVPPRISYIEGNETKYVEYNRSLEWQRKLSITHLDKGIDADIARRDAEIAANKFLQPLVKQYGDLPAQTVVGLWLHDQRAAQPGS